MSFWTRIVNVIRRDRIDDEIAEEMRLHIEDAIAAGRDPDEARRAFGPMLRTREESRDIKLATWLDSLRSDAVFGWRLLNKNRTASGAAILSLALAIGACTAAFRLVDAILLRPLPVAGADRLYFLQYEFVDQNGKKDTGSSFEYPLFRTLRAAAQPDAELMAISYASRIDLTVGAGEEVEKAYRQYISGWTLPAFGLKPALGRLLTTEDDRTPGAHPYAVISHDYWVRRFGGDPKVLGTTLHIGKNVFEIIGVISKGFTGTETGSMTDIFVPTMMNAKAIDDPNWGWFRIWMQTQPGIDPETVRQKLAVSFHSHRAEHAKNWKGALPKIVESYVNAPLTIESASAGVSHLQQNYRRALLILGALVGLLLLIACANVANLMMAQAAARAREMALRISIGAGRARLVQLVLVESALLATIATTVGSLFAWWSAPFVVGLIERPQDPARLLLPTDARVLAFGAALTILVIFLFGLAPALRASSIKPMAAIRGGDPHSRRRLMNALVAAQVAFCFLVHLVAGLFVASFERLSNQPTGFSTERLLLLETVAAESRPPEAWEELRARLAEAPGVEQAAMSSWSLMSGNIRTGGVRVPGKQWDSSPPYFLAVSPGWLSIMRIPLLHGRDFRHDEAAPTVAVVNEAFAKRYFDGQNPVGRTFDQSRRDKTITVQIIGFVRDARYRDMREAPRPTVYVPLRSFNDNGKLESQDWSSLVVRTASKDPLDMAMPLRKVIAAAGGGFRVTTIDTQQAIVDFHTIRERLLATLSLFFAIVALILAGVGLYGVLNYSVTQRRREIGIRMALGAQSTDVAWRVTAEVLSMLILGSALGLAAGISSERYLETLLFQVKSTDWRMLALPAATILLAGLVASLPAILRAVRIDPANVLRAE